jgi:hypothetical protein
VSNGSFKGRCPNLADAGQTIRLVTQVGQLLPYQSGTGSKKHFLTRSILHVHNRA